ncbi:MAG TPA: N-acetylneuraminate synthase family protein [Candidatus Limnocylindrales bacterium]
MSTGAILFLIPARGGSKRVPGKNLRTVAGIPLVGAATRLGRRVANSLPGGGHAVVCSTDDAGIATTARDWGAEVLDRPAELATDTATSVDVALHAIAALAARGRAVESIVLLQPTSPLTDPADVRAAIERHRATGAPVVAVTAATPASWRFGLGADGILGEPGEAGADAAVQLCGAFYVIGTDELASTRRFVTVGRTLGQLVPASRAVDVDVEDDITTAEALAAIRPNRSVEIDGHGLGGGGAFVIAEGGVNHNGEVELARRLVDAAADAGADAVKFQTFDPVALAAAGAPQAAYQAERGPAADQRQMLEALTLPRAAWPELQARARARGLVFLSTPFDDGSADLLDELGVPAFKVGSGELTNLGFLARLAARGRPMLVSTGMGSMLEVADAVDTIAGAGNPPLALLQCVSAYPSEVEDSNLRAIDTMRRAFGVPVGWSDHSTGIEAAMTAVALGAAIVEKHLTLSRDLPGPDQAASLEPAAFQAMVGAIRRVEASLGTGVKAPAAAELPIAAVARRSLHWARSREAGERITADDFAVLRPGTGMAPSHAAGLVGSRLARAVEAGAAVEAADIADGAP